MTTRTDLVKHANGESNRDHLEHEADRIRTRLAHTLDQLNQRRHEATDVKLQARRHLGGILLIVGGAALFGAGVAVASYRAARARTSPWVPSFWTRSRARAAARAWQHPDRVARGNDTSFGGLLRKVLIGTITFTLTEIAKRNIRHALPHDEGDGVTHKHV